MTAEYSDMELSGVSVFRRALTQEEIQKITDHYLSYDDVGFTPDSDETRKQFLANKLGLDTVADDDVLSILKDAVFHIDSKNYGGGEYVQNLGWRKDTLNARMGSSQVADSNDPKFLAWEGENYVYLPGVSGNYLSVPDDAALDITGDIDIRVRVAFDSWTGAVSRILASKTFGSSTDTAWYFFVRSNGGLGFYWTEDGSSLKTTLIGTVTELVNGEPKWLRVTLDVDNGASGNDVAFYVSDDGVTWTQTGLTITTAGTTSIHNSSRPVEILAEGKVHRAIVKDGINGTTVLDVDTSLVASGSDTSFTALTGQTVTIGRSTSGRKAVAVTHPVWLFGTDDYMEVADNDLLDFGASDSFTVLAVARQWATAGFRNVVSKRNVTGGSGAQGYSLYLATFVSVPRSVFAVGDGSDVAIPIDNTTGLAYGTLGTLVAKLDRSTDLASIQTGTASAITASSASVDSVSNSLAFRIGKTISGIDYADMEFIAAAVFRKALTAGEISTLNNYFQGRVA